MKPHQTQLSTLAALLLIAARVASADVTLNALFTDNLVLQRDVPVPVWGTADPGEAVTVEFAGQKKNTTASADGKWRVDLDASPASNENRVLIVSGNRSPSPLSLKDVLVGEVWICSGQSNMEWRLNQCPGFTETILASADNPQIRQIKIPLRAYDGDPLPAFTWQKFDVKNAPYFSAVAYFFAAALQERLGVPVGLVNCSFGGTPIEAWLSPEAISQAGSGPLLDEDKRKAAQFPDAAAYERAWQEYQDAKKTYDEKKKAGALESALGPAPKEPYGYRTKTRPSGLRGAMLSVITPFAARGVLWYQGENNAGRPDDYRALLTALIAELRRDWQQPDWPVLIGQISSPTANWPDEQDPYARIREAQRAVATADPHSGLVVTLDYGERGNVHPTNKQPVGERFARLALGRVYGAKGASPQSPIAVAAVEEAGKIRVRFDAVPGKLELRAPSVPTLEVSKDGAHWLPATAEITPDGKALLITPPPESAPVRSLRYAFQNFCPLTIYTDEGLPVAPWNLEIEK